MPSANRAKNTKDGHIIYAIAILDNEFAATMYVCMYKIPNFSLNLYKPASVIASGIAWFTHQEIKLCLIINTKVRLWDLNVDKQQLMNKASILLQKHD